jgi:hypothetical protein
MIWRDGIVPEGAQEFSPSLTADLLAYGYGTLALALHRASCTSGCCYRKTLIALLRKQRRAMY